MIEDEIKSALECKVSSKTTHQGVIVIALLDAKIAWACM